MPKRDRPPLIVVGASAGGVEALTRLVAGLPPDLPAAVAVVLHVPASGPSVLPAVLDRAGPLPAAEAEEGGALVPGRIAVAPRDRHLLVVDGRFSLSSGPKENGHRPAVDPLFTSAALQLGEDAVGVILSGTLDDGAAGMAAVALAGGRTVVQDPSDALYPGMPASAIDRVDVDHVAPVAALPDLLASLVAGRPVAVTSAPGGEPEEADGAVAGEPAGDELAAGPGMRGGEAAGLSCPDCGGSLWSVGDHPTTRYRCRIGHAYSERSLLEEQGRALELALWTAVRSLEERAALLRRMAHRALASGQERSGRRFRDHASELETQAGTIRAHIVPAAVASEPEAARGA